ncbi:MAG: hypothetical protein RCG15_02450 [Candidatus Rickettsia vulgarisii]
MDKAQNLTPQEIKEFNNKLNGYVFSASVNFPINLGDTKTPCRSMPFIKMVPKTTDVYIEDINKLSKEDWIKLRSYHKKEFDEIFKDIPFVQNKIAEYEQLKPKKQLEKENLLSHKENNTKKIEELLSKNKLGKVHSLVKGNNISEIYPHGPLNKSEETKLFEKNVRGKSIKALSKYPNEKEYLLPPSTQLKWGGYKKTDKGHVFVVEGANVLINEKQLPSYKAAEEII